MSSIPPQQDPWPSLDLGPQVPMAVYHSQEIWNAQRIGALALYCSDGRWGDACDEFCHRHLHIPRYDRWAADAIAALKPGSNAGAYVNFLADEGTAGLAAAYPAATWDRLRRVKRQYDPENLFRLNQNVPPAA